MDFFSDHLNFKPLKYWSQQWKFYVCKVRKNQKVLLFLLLINLIYGLLVSSQNIYAQEKSAPSLTVNFEGNKSHLQILQSASSVSIQGPQFSNEHPAAGKACEELLINSSQLGDKVVLGIDFKPSRILQDTEISLQVHSPAATTIMSVSVTFPETIDPRTNQPFVGIIFSEPHKANKDWEQIVLKISEDIWQERTRLWKAQLRPQLLDTRKAYLHQAQLHMDCQQGKNFIRIDELKLSPFVADEIASSEQANKPSEVKFGMGRITVQDRPFLPIIIPYHGEDLNALKKAGFNVIWVDEQEVPKLADQCESLGLWMTTSPPVDWDEVNSTDSNILEKRIGDDYRRVIFWNLGTRIDFSNREKFKKIAQRIRAIDPWHRPLCIDVKDAEEVFSRDVEILSISRHVLHTTSTLQDFRQHLLTRSSLAEPGAFLQTHIQTEPSPTLIQYCLKTNANQPVIEPEQIRQQVYAGMTCGIRGISYWKSAPWNSTPANQHELLLACEQLHQELSILEPFLATGAVVDHLEFEIGEQFDDNQNSILGVSRSPLDKNNFSLTSRTKNIPEDKKLSNNQHHATIIQSDWGHLLLASWLDPLAQYTPGTLTSPDARFVIRGVPESALAWEITPTSMIPLEMQRVAGGVEIRLKRSNSFHRFDQTAAILICSNRNIEAQVQLVINQIKQKSADSSIQLVETKWHRVKQILAELAALGQGLPNDAILSRFVEQLIGEAHRKIAAEDYHTSRLLSARAMQIIRNMQFAHWQHAVNKVEHPSSTPYTVCFQTLPDFWKLMGKVGSSNQAMETKLVESGEFEDIGFMQQEGWQREINPQDQIQSFVELHPEHQGKTGDYSLRMTCIPKNQEDIPVIIRKSPIKLHSPRLPLKKGDILYISGYITVDQPVKGSLQGIRIYDSILDTSGSIMWKDNLKWTPFQIIREIPEDQDYQLTCELTGMGDCRFDHFKFKVLNITPVEVVKETPSAEKKSNTFTNSLEFLERLSPIKSGKDNKPEKLP